MSKTLDIEVDDAETLAALLMMSAMFCKVAQDHHLKILNNAGDGDEELLTISDSMIIELVRWSNVFDGLS